LNSIAILQSKVNGTVGLNATKYTTAIASGNITSFVAIKPSSAAIQCVARDALAKQAKACRSNPGSAAPSCRR
jgi:hypothetical protein